MNVEFVLEIYSFTPSTMSLCYNQFTASQDSVMFMYIPDYKA